MTGKSKSKSEVVVCVLVLFAVSLLMAGCGSNPQNAQAAGAGTAPPAASVTVSVAQQEPVPVDINAIGNAEPFRTVQVKSMVDGQIERVLFQQGEEVQAGQVLFELDKRPFEAALNQAQAKLAQDKATAANSAAQASRAESLLKQGIIAAQDAQASESQARANAAAVEADNAAVQTAKLNLAYTDIKAPIAARAGAILVNVGNLVKANDTNALTTLNQVEPIYVSFNVPEADLPSVRQKGVGRLKVNAFLQGLAKAETGTLSFIDNTVDATTGTIKLMATFPNRERHLWPGSFVNVKLQLGAEAHAVVVPSAAVETGPEGKYVYVVQPDGTAVIRTVNSPRSYGQLAVIGSGVQAGERVVVDGQIRVVPNNKVNVVKTEPLPPLQPQANSTEANNDSGLMQ